ncbi:transcription initiation factor TFIID subunit 1 [Perkinsela sp. CCAP 1560/4]|nr:transcription initiation factor TFIID subunit 1 [Perkinsela sp. CCAP 1560/4]|eukprot:KNH05303.1 transcription initiation factor TFIID subunit 1 [Perkinsela sp. CCAP 1560/4]
MKRGEENGANITEIDIFIVDQVMQKNLDNLFDPLQIASELYASMAITIPLDSIVSRFFHLLNSYGSIEKLAEANEKKKAHLAGSATTLSQVNHKAEIVETRLMERLLSCIDQICSSPLSDIFREPVEPNIFMSFNQCYEGPYMTRVFRPMDLSSVRSHILNGKISSGKSLLQYLTLISTNCVFFNSPDSEFPKRAMQFFQLCYTTLESSDV